MPLTAHPDIDPILIELVAEIGAALGATLIGVYLYGSLVWGDFDPHISDIDLLAATSTEIDDRTCASLEQMHQRFVERYPPWLDRIEVAYVSLRALQTFKTHTSEIAVISPGEPFHRKEAGRDWLMNWYLIQEKGVTLDGPPPSTIIEHISHAEFRDAVKQQARSWHNYIGMGKDSRPFQAYAILTMCRALYVCKQGEQVSKQRAAAWAQAYVPEWSWLIQQALTWRERWRDQTVDHRATFPDTQRFVEFMIEQIIAA